MARTAVRRAKKKALKNGEMIPGVPSFQGGGQVNPFIDPIFSGSIPTSASTFNLPRPTNFSSFAGGGGGGSGGGSTSAQQQLLNSGFLQIDGDRFLDPNSGNIIDLRDPRSFSGGGGGSSTPQFRPGELDLMRDQFGLEEQQFALDQEISRAQLGIQRTQNELTKLRDQRADQIARGQLQLAKQTEARIAKVEQQRIKLDRALGIAQFRLQAQLGRSQGLTNIGSSLGNIEAQRAQFLSNIAANPRDVVQTNIALGGGKSPLTDIFAGQTPEGQGVSRIGDQPLLGESFQKLIDAVTARPDLEFFNQAQNLLAPNPFAGPGPSLPQFAGGGEMVTDEPIVGIGTKSGQPRFTLGEPTAQFPEGAPELLNITPFAHGGQVGFSGVSPTRSAQPLPTGGGVGFRGSSPPPSPGSLGGFVPGQGLVGPFGPQAPVRETPFLGPPTAVRPVPSAAPPVVTPFPAIQPGGGAMSVQEAIAAVERGEVGINAISAAIAREQAQAAAAPPPEPSLSQGQLLKNALSAIDPRTFFNMLPSARGELESRISALALDPADFFASLLQGFPGGPNPNAVSFGNFSAGGQVATRVA